MLDKRFVPEPFLPQLAMERAAEAKRKARQAEEALARELGAVHVRKQGIEIYEKALDDDAGPPKAEHELEEHEKSPPPRPRPLLVLVARDIPSVAKRKIVDRLCNELEGEFVRVCSDLPQGIDPRGGGQQVGAGGDQGGEDSPGGSDAM